MQKSEKELVERMVVAMERQASALERNAAARERIAAATEQINNVQVDMVKKLLPTFMLITDKLLKDMDGQSSFTFDPSGPPANDNKPQ